MKMHKKPKTKNQNKNNEWHMAIHIIKTMKIEGVC